MKRTISISIIVILILLTVPISSVFAYNNGLLQGLPMIYTNNTVFGSTVETTYAATDNNLSTSYGIDYPGPRYLQATLPAPKTVDKLYINVRSTMVSRIEVKVRLYNSSKQLLATFHTLPNGYKSFTAVANVKYVVISNELVAVLPLYELDIFESPVIVPADVTGVTARGISEHDIQIDWTNPTNVTMAGLDVYQNNVKITRTNATATTYIANSLMSNTQYTFKLVVIDSQGNQSNGVTFVASTLAPDLEPPAEIKNLQSYVYNDRIKFTWENPPDIDFHEVRIYKNNIQIAVATTPANQFTDYDLQEHTTYTFVFRSVDKTGNVSAGISVTETTKGKPVQKVFGITGEAFEGEVNLSWWGHSDGTVQGYNIYQDGVKIGSTTIETTYNVKELTNGQTYQYYVKAYNQYGESPQSDEIQLTPVVIEIPDKPNVDYTSTNNSITLTWQSVKFARSYKVYRITESDPSVIENLFFDRVIAASEELITETTGTSYTISGLRSGEEVIFYVSALNEKGESEKAEIKTKTILKMEFGVTEFLLITFQYILMFANLILLILAVKFAPRLVRFLKALSQKNGVKF